MSNFEHDLQRPIEPRAGAWRKITAVIEVVGMLVVANAILLRLEPVLHIPQVGPLLQLAANGPSIRQSYVGGILLLHLALRGAIFVALVFAVDQISGRRDPDRHGLSLAGQSLGGLLLAGLLAAGVAGLPLKCFAVAVHFQIFGSSGGSEAYMFLRRQWGAAFWFLYILAMCVVVPCQEEFLFRGYAQRRLASAFGAAGFIVLGALFFTLQHLSEYLYRLDVPNVAQLLCMAFDAMVLGYLMAHEHPFCRASLCMWPVLRPFEGLTPTSRDAGHGACLDCLLSHMLPARENFLSASSNSGYTRPRRDVPSRRRYGDLRAVRESRRLAIRLWPVGRIIL